MPFAAYDRYAFAALVHTPTHEHDKSTGHSLSTCRID